MPITGNNTHPIVVCRECWGHISFLFSLIGPQTKINYAAGVTLNGLYPRASSAYDLDDLDIESLAFEANEICRRFWT